MHVAVAGVHVQGDPDAAAQHPLVNLVDGLQHRRERFAAEQPPQVTAHFRLPRCPDGAVLQDVEDTRARLAFHAALQFGAQRLEAQLRELRQSVDQQRVEMLAQISPARARLGQDLLRLWLAIAQRLLQLQVAGEILLQLVQQPQLVLERQLDVDALDRVGVVAHALERDHDVFVDLERVRVTRNRRGARAVQPEFLARVRVDGDEALTGAAVGDAHDF